MKTSNILLLILLAAYGIPCTPLLSQIGTRFPSERKIVRDPVTGIDLVFLTSTPSGDHKIYQTHNQWTSDGKWLIFRSRRVRGEAMAVHEQSGDIVQVTEGGYRGTLLVARESMKLYYMKGLSRDPEKNDPKIVEVDLEKLFADSESGSLKEESAYQRVCASIPPGMGPGGDMALDAGEEWIWFRVGKTEAGKHLPEGTTPEPDFGPRNMGAGPGGIAGVNLHTGEIKYVVSVPFQVGHIQSNPRIPGQIVFCWETGGKSPQRTWIVNSDGTGLRPLYPEAPYEWVTHETYIGPDEVAFAIMGHREIRNIGGGEDPEPEGDRQTNPGQEPKGNRQTNPGQEPKGNRQTNPGQEPKGNRQTNPGQEPKGNRQTNPGQEPKGNRQTNPGQEPGWGDTGTREKPTGLGVVNVNTHEMMIEGQIPYGSGFWHVTGSYDGRFLAGDNFTGEIYLIDRHTHEMMLLSAGHKRTAADHPHPSFSPDGTRIVIQSAMLSADDRSMNICVIPLPEE
ncbi:MAG: hypothetical protein R6U78_05335 [Bacteroidales bacterium]